MSDKKLTVVIMSYNHASSIVEAISSVVMQSIFDQINVIISDDCSTDSTMDKVYEVSVLYPNIIVVENPKNMGIMEHYKHVVSSVCTEYIAILEGDDVWIDAQKLEKQVNFLDNFIQTNCVFTGFTVRKDDEDIQDCSRLLGNNRNGFFYFEDLLSQNLIASFTNCMYRTDKFLSVLSNRKMIAGFDWLINLCLSSESPVGYLSGDFSHYKVHENGTWSKLDNNKKKEMILDTLSILTEFVSQEKVKLIELYIDHIEKEKVF